MRSIMANIVREGTNPVWGIFMICAVLGILGLDFYWLFTESGLIRFLAEKQAAVLGGKWYPKVTFLILLLSQIGVLLLIKKLVELVSGKKMTQP